MARVRVKKEPKVSEQFAALMRRYKALSEAAEAAKTDAKRRAEVVDNLKRVIGTEVLNMGIGPGSTLRAEGVGRFHFTTKRYYAVPTGTEREILVQMLLDEGSLSLLTIGKKDLNDWCQDRVDQELEIPSYIRYYEDREVPVISLVKAPNEVEE